MTQLFQIHIREEISRALICLWAQLKNDLKVILVYFPLSIRLTYAFLWKITCLLEKNKTSKQQQQQKATWFSSLKIHINRNLMHLRLKLISIIDKKVRTLYLRVALTSNIYRFQMLLFKKHLLTFFYVQNDSAMLSSDSNNATLKHMTFCNFMYSKHLYICLMQAWLLFLIFLNQVFKALLSVKQYSHYGIINQIKILLVCASPCFIK